jgi:TPR repeat protein
MYKNLSIIFSSLILLIFYPQNLSADGTCKSLYDDKLWDEALPECEEEKSYFKLGYIYGQMLNCDKSVTNYKLADSAMANMNIGIAYFYGSSGCKKDKELALESLKKAAEQGTKISNYFIGEYYSDSNEKLAEKFYKLAIQSTDTKSEWVRNRLDRSLREYRKISSFDEQVEYFLEPNPISRFVINKFLKDWFGLGERLNSKLMSYLIDNSQKKWFEERLPSDYKAFFIGQQFEAGVGRVENFLEAYRMYLIAGSEGLNIATAARKRIRKHLSPEQLETAQCLSQYGFKPSFINKAYCKW